MTKLSQAALLCLSNPIQVCILLSKPLFWGREPAVTPQEQRPWCATCEGISGCCPLIQRVLEILAKHTRMPWAAARPVCAAHGRCPLYKPEKTPIATMMCYSITCLPTFQGVLQFAKQRVPVGRGGQTLRLEDFMETVSGMQGMACMPLEEHPKLSAYWHKSQKSLPGLVWMQ